MERIVSRLIGLDMLHDAEFIQHINGGVYIPLTENYAIPISEMTDREIQETVTGVTCCDMDMIPETAELEKFAPHECFMYENPKDFLITQKLIKDGIYQDLNQAVSNHLKPLVDEMKIEVPINSQIIIRNGNIELALYAENECFYAEKLNFDQTSDSDADLVNEIEIAISHF